MAISNITTQSLISSLGYLDPNQNSVSDSSSTDAISALSGDSSSSSSSSGTSLTSISQIASLLSKLAKLEKSDPDSFKEVAAEIAQDFHDAAPQCSDTLQRLSLESLAGQFSNASITGSLKDFNLGKATSGSAKAYMGQSTLTLLDYLNGSNGTDLTSMFTSKLSGLGNLTV